MLFTDIFIHRWDRLWFRWCWSLLLFLSILLILSVILLLLTVLLFRFRLLLICLFLRIGFICLFGFCILRYLPLASREGRKWKRNRFPLLLEKYIFYFDVHVFKWMDCWYFGASVEKKYVLGNFSQSFLWTVVFLKNSVQKPCF